MKYENNLQEEYKINFSKQLNYYMKLNHKKQDDIIKDLGINKSTISTWCRGTKMPRLDSVQMLADYFGITISDFLTGAHTNEIPNKLTKTQQELFDLIIQMNDDQIHLAIEMIQSILDSHD